MSEAKCGLHWVVIYGGVQVAAFGTHTMADNWAKQHCNHSNVEPPAIVEYDRQLTALTQRAEQVERERDTVVESQTFILKSVEEIAAARAAAEAEVKRLREGIHKKGEELRTGEFCRMCEHMQGMCDCKEISAEYDALLAQPSDGKEAGDDE